MLCAPRALTGDGAASSPSLSSSSSEYSSREDAAVGRASSPSRLCTALSSAVAAASTPTAASCARSHLTFGSIAWMDHCDEMNGDRIRWITILACGDSVVILWAWGSTEDHLSQGTLDT